MFAPKIRGNKNSDRDTIIQSYQKLFDITYLRRMMLKDLQWQKAPDKALGVGRFDITLKEKGQPDSQFYTGDITINIEKQNLGLMITGLVYSYH